MADAASTPHTQQAVAPCTVNACNELGGGGIAHAPCNMLHGKVLGAGARCVRRRVGGCMGGVR